MAVTAVGLFEAMGAPHGWLFVPPRPRCRHRVQGAQGTLVRPAAACECQAACAIEHHAPVPAF